MIRRICPTCGRARYITLPSEGGNELLPCPFCGGTPKVMIAPDIWIQCTECGAMSEFSATEENAVRKWNRRV